MASQKIVIVTGFGPFGDHKVNASWEAVKELQNMEPLPGVTMVTKEMPVVYDEVKETVPSLWKEYKPQLVVHVGVHGQANEIILEQKAHNTGYYRQDICMKTPELECCIKDGEDCLQNTLNIQTVCDTINSTDNNLKSITSNDPGRYLCDFSYYLSLSENRAACLFVHVPPLGEPYSAIELAQALRIVIQCLLKQIESSSMKA